MTLFADSYCVAMFRVRDDWLPAEFFSDLFECHVSESFRVAHSVDVGESCGDFDSGVVNVSDPCG